MVVLMLTHNLANVDVIDKNVNTANKIPLPSAGKFSDQSGPPKQRIIIEGIAPISAKPINLGLGVMPLMFRFHPM